MNYGDKIRILRKLYGLTQSDLARQVHSTQQSIARYEKGKSEPSLEMLTSIATVLSVPVSFLIGNTELHNESEFIALYRSLSEDDKKRAIEYLRFLRKKELEERAFYKDE